MIRKTMSALKRYSDLFRTWILRHSLIFYAVIVVAIIVFTRLCNNDYLKGVIVNILICMILATALNATNGYSGQMNLGMAGFVCIGAYTTALLMTRGVNYWISMVCSGMLAALVGILVSIPTLRLKGIFLAIVSMGFSEIIRLIALNWSSVTGGPMGVKGIPRPVFIGITVKTTEQFTYLTLLLLILCLICTSRILKSRIGRAWLAIREDEEAAWSLGINTKFYRSLSFSYGAFWAGVGGSILPVFYLFINSDMFSLEESFNILSMVIIGGQGTLVGPLLGSIIVNSLSEVFRFAVEYRYVIYAIMILVILYIKPQGLMGDAGIFKKAKKLPKIMKNIDSGHDHNSDTVV
jgi:branched-chain amino acid transport system permease protein